MKAVATLLLVVLLGSALAVQAPTKKTVAKAAPSKAYLTTLDKVPATIWVKDPRQVDQIAVMEDMYIFRYKPVEAENVAHVTDLAYNGKTGILLIRVENTYHMPGMQPISKRYYEGNSTAWFQGVDYTPDGRELPAWPDGTHEIRVRTQLNGAQQRAHNTQARG